MGHIVNQTECLNRPRVFISYSWDDEEHKEWVKKFTDDLLKNGVEAYLDQYDAKIGKRLPKFMEEQITNADFVLIICTEEYKRKADLRIAGVGYEGHIISAEILANHKTEKFIPILKTGTFELSIPKFLSGVCTIDLSKEKNYDENLKKLLMTLYGYEEKPKLGKLPDFLFSNDVVVKSADIRIVGIIEKEITIPKMDGSRGSALYKIPFKLSNKPTELWKKLFIDNWNNPPTFTTMHRFGIASVYDDVVVLDGTTIEEVEKYHKETLLKCIDKTNEQEKIILEKERLKKKKRNELIEEHYNNVKEKVKRIKF